MTRDDDAAVPLKAPLRFFLIGVIALGLVVRVARLTTAKLWTDEIFSAAMAKESPVAIIGLTLREDAHPPLYYLYLHLWELWSDNDVFLLMNSFVLSLITGIVLFLIMRRLYNQATALLSVAVYAVLPLELIFAETLRMYELEGLLALLAYFVSERFVQGLGNERTNLITFAVIGNCLNLLHGFGLFVTFFLVCYTLARSQEERLPLEKTKKFLSYALVSGFTGLYTLLLGSQHTTIGLTSASFSSISDELTIALLGFDIPMPWITGLSLVGPFVILCLWDRASRTVGWWLFVAPTALMIATSIFVKPVYTYRGTGLFLPFFAISLALLLAPRLRSQIHRRPTWDGLTVFIGLFAVLITATLHNGLSYKKSWFAGASDFWATHAQSGDVIYIDSMTSDYLGFVRYLPGQSHPYVHEVRPPPPDHWERIFSRLGPTVVNFFHLRPDAYSLTYHGREVVPWLDKAAAARRNRFWVFRHTVKPCDVPGYQAVPAYVNVDFSIILCRRIAPAGLPRGRATKKVSGKNDWIALPT